MEKSRKTLFYDKHVALGANMVDFAGWNMPLHYKSGIIEEHLMTRKHAGLFDVSHMGRFVFRGEQALPFLQHVLSNDAGILKPGQSQYTIIPNDRGGAVDDAWLYRFVQDEYLLVVNAGNKEKDWAQFQEIKKGFKGVEMIDRSEDMAMLSVQGPASKSILNEIIDSGPLPELKRNALCGATVKRAKVLIGATGYTGEQVCFELFIESKDALMIWDLLIEYGAFPVGLGARDTLRLEAGLPLYGHEFGLDPSGKEIPVFSFPFSRFAVSFSYSKGNFAGRDALARQFEALEKIRRKDYSLKGNLPRLIKHVALTEKGVARPGAEVFSGEKHAGFITSGTMVPYWKTGGADAGEKGMRAICLALLDSDLQIGGVVEVDIRGKRVKGEIVSSHLRRTEERK